MDKAFLDLLVCPETKRSLEEASPAIVHEINVKIEAGSIKNRAGQTVEKQIDGGLIAGERAEWLYPIQDGIPILIMEESISLLGSFPDRKKTANEG